MLRIAETIKKNYCLALYRQRSRESHHYVKVILGMNHRFFVFSSKDSARHHKVISNIVS